MCLAFQRRIDANLAGWRLDKALCFLKPPLSLRAARRLIERGYALVNGQKPAPSRKLALNDLVSLAKAQEEEIFELPSLLSVADDYCCLFKPAGLHTVDLAGSAQKSLESFLPELTPHIAVKPLLLQRLDYQTRGLVCAALNPGAASRFRQAEKDASCEKFYYALLEGRLDKAVSVDNAIDMDNRKKCKVLKKRGTRVTCIEPLVWLDGEELSALRLDTPCSCTLARCKISVGCRHQIRAHAASIGFPLVGDTLYGSRGKGAFLLEHYRLRFFNYKFDLPHAKSIFTQFLREREKGII